MRVYLLRHGDAEHISVSGRDEDRQLTREGTAKLERASRGWQRVLGPVDRVLASPLIRARQTAEILHRAASVTHDIVETPELVPHARPSAVLPMLQHEMQEGADGVACVGHEPHMGGLLGLLLTGDERSSIPFKKGQLVIVELYSSADMIGQLRESLTQQAAAGL